MDSRSPASTRLQIQNPVLTSKCVPLEHLERLGAFIEGELPTWTLQTRAS